MKFQKLKSGKINVRKIKVWKKFKSKKFKSEILSLIHDRSVVVQWMSHCSIEWSLKKKIKNEIPKVAVGKNQCQKNQSLKSLSWKSRPETMSLEVWKLRLWRLCLGKCQNFVCGDYVSDFLYKIIYKQDSWFLIIMI